MNDLRQIVLPIRAIILCPTPVKDMIRSVYTFKFAEFSQIEKYVPEPVVIRLSSAALYDMNKKNR
jgi:hypothetical protein